MGNYVSKYILHNMENESQKDKEKEEEKEVSNVEKNNSSVAEELADEHSAKSIDMQTPKTNEKVLPLDPRSITAGITRTPIVIDSTPVTMRKTISAIPRHLQPKQRYLETDLDKVMPCLTPKKRCIPRIVKGSSETQLKDSDPATEQLNKSAAKSTNRRDLTPLEKDRFKILGIDPRSPAAEFDRTPILVCARTLEHEASEKFVENLARRGSYGADNTNFSYCETSSEFMNVVELQAFPDMVTQLLKSVKLDDIGAVNGCNDFDKSGMSYCSAVESLSEDSSDATDSDASEELNSKPVNIKIENADQENNKAESDDDLVKQGTENLQIVIWNDPVFAEPSENVKNVQTESSNECIKLRVNNTIKNKSSKMNSTKIEYDTQCQNKKCAPVTNLNKALNKMENETIKTRTPLANRSNNGQVQTLSLNSPQQLFRKKNVTQKTLQENTPLHKSCSVKSKLVQWDPNSTVLI